MKVIVLSSLLVFATPLLAQSLTPTPTPAQSNDWAPPWATNDPGKWSSIYNSLAANSRIPSTLTAAPWPTNAWGPGSGPWGPAWAPGGRAPNRPESWGGPDGQGPFGSTPPPWATDSVANSAWRSGPWTAWWGGTACPPAEWPGWTAGPWSENAPWTSWAACEASTTATTVGTATVNGSAVVTTAFGLRVAAASVGAEGSTGGSGARVTQGVGAVVGVVLAGVVVGL